MNSAGMVACGSSGSPEASGTADGGAGAPSPSGDAPSLVACNEDKSASDLRPEVTFTLAAGATYFVALGRVDGPSSKVALHFDD